jgi:hypothetical protein
MAMSKTAELVATPPQVSQEEMRLVEIQNRRRAAEQNFNRAFSDMTNQRMMLQKSINTMEQRKREFHSAQEEESAELMRLGLKR